MVSNHDELMCNFFAQADALATGKSAIELRAEQVPDYLVPHKTFTGNRPSMSIMLPDLTAYTIGQVLALYELRIGVQVSPTPFTPGPQSYIPSVQNTFFILLVLALNWSPPLQVEPGVLTGDIPKLSAGKRL